MPVRIAVLFLVLGAGVFAGEPNRGPFEKIAIIHLRDDSEDAIDNALKVSVLRRIQEARDWGADCVIFDIESYGGAVGASVDTADEIYDLGRDVHTIAYVHRRAISGAAMLSVSCREIVMNEVALIGDSQVIFASGEKAPEKMQTVVAEKFRSYAEGNHYPAPLLEAMVREETEVVRYKKPVDPSDPSQGFTWVYYRSDQASFLPSRREIEEQFLTDQEIVVPEGQIATFTARRAEDYGLASRLLPNLDALLADVGADDAAVHTFQWIWTEEVSRWLLGMRWLLFLLGAAAVYTAFKTPGTGVPEALALVFFGLYFGAAAVANLAGTLEVVLFFAGVALLITEIFVLPGLGVAGFAGLGCLLTAIALAAVPESGPAFDTTGSYLLPLAADFLIGLAGATVLALLLARYLPQVPFFRRLSLPVPAAVAPASDADPAPAPAIVGCRGVAETALRPAGRALIEGAHHDVVAEGGAYVPVGGPLRVVAVRGNVIVVRAE